MADLYNKIDAAKWAAHPDAPIIQEWSPETPVFNLLPPVDSAQIDNLQLTYMVSTGLRNPQIRLIGGTVIASASPSKIPVTEQLKLITDVFSIDKAWEGTSQYTAQFNSGLQDSTISVGKKINYEAVNGVEGPQTFDGIDAIANRYSSKLSSLIQTNATKVTSAATAEAVLKKMQTIYYAMNGMVDAILVGQGTQELLNDIHAYTHVKNSQSSTTNVIGNNVVSVILGNKNIPIIWAGRAVSSTDGTTDTEVIANTTVSTDQYCKLYLLNLSSSGLGLAMQMRDLSMDEDNFKWEWAVEAKCRVVGYSKYSCGYLNSILN